MADQNVVYLRANRAPKWRRPHAVGGPHLRDPHADYLPVDPFLIIIHVDKLPSPGTGAAATGCMRDEQTGGCRRTRERT